MQIERNKNYNISLPAVASVAFILICFIFQTNNSTIDAYGYAADIKYGENIFRPHHLLYNALGYALSLIFIESEPLVMMQTINALFALGCLWVLYAILRLLNFDIKFNRSAILICASSFGLLRFATENEVYIIPLFFSLTGTFYFIRYQLQKKISLAIYSSILMGIAALFHQMHIIWLLVTAATFIISNRKNGVLYLLISSIIVAVVYFSIIIFYNHESLTIDSICRFVLYDYYSGEATSTVGLSNFYLTGINFMRSFIQIHGNIYYLIKCNYIYIIPIAICTFLLLVQIKKYIKYKSGGLQVDKPYPKTIKNYILSVFLAHLLFAFYAQGNAEFMVMLPFLAIIYLGFILEKYHIDFRHTGMAIFVWNLSYALIPQTYDDLQNKEYLMKHYHKEDIYILQQANLYKNMFYYSKHITYNNIYKTPSDYKGKNQKYYFLDSLIKHSNSLILTDAIGNQNIVTRKNLLSDDFDLKFFSNYNLIPFYTQKKSLDNYQLMQIENGKQENSNH